MTALYNEIEPYAVEWLGALIAVGELPAGIVESRSIRDLSPSDCSPISHFFAGIGGWAHALRCAGWPDDLPVWTGSCPCQPFSSAGKGEGFADERHLWPVWFPLIRECCPPVVFGEQVASKDGLAWLDLVCADLEGCGYAFGASVLPAASVGAPHMRHRIYFVAVRSVADDDEQGLCQFGRSGLRADRLAPRGHDADGCGADGAPTCFCDSDCRICDGCIADGHGCEYGRAFWMANPYGRARGQGRQERGRRKAGSDAAARAGSGGLRVAGDLGHADEQGRQGRPGERGDDGTELAAAERAGGASGFAGPGPVNGFWSNAEWIACSDGRSRATEPGSFPLAHGLPRSLGRLSPEQQRVASLAGLSRKSLKAAKRYRTGSLRGYGNAICDPLAVEFIRAAMECLP